jgi:glycolate oxidase iron-sulfur subunit
MAAPTSSGERVSHLKRLDYSVVQQCMHCGLCLPTCPTYDATKLERSSPRGRIALMRAIADDRLELTREFGAEMYFCLGCLACMTACPAGVNYAELFEHARAEVEARRVLAAPKRDFLRWFAVRWLFMDLRRLELVGRALRLYQRLGLQTAIRRLGLVRLLPRRLRELEAMTPTICEKFSADLIAPLTPATGQRRYRVALLTGCAQDLIFSNINHDTAAVLAQNGCEVFTPPRQHCCGSLHAHNGEWALAQELARRNIDQFPPEQFDAIISNAGGCGSHLRHYANLLVDDPAYQPRAKLWDAKLKDIHEWLGEIKFRVPSSKFQVSGATPRVQQLGTRNLEPGTQLVTYHESCHLSHGQKIVNQLVLRQRGDLQSHATGNGRATSRAQAPAHRSHRRVHRRHGQSRLPAPTGQRRPGARPDAAHRASDHAAGGGLSQSGQLTP